MKSSRHNDNQLYFPSKVIPQVEKRHRVEEIESFDSKIRTRISQIFSEEDAKIQRNMANKRERKRTESLNQAFLTLRKIIPSLPSDKMSKIQTLRLACIYIDFLLQILDTEESVEELREKEGDEPDLIHQQLARLFSLYRMKEE